MSEAAGETIRVAAALVALLLAAKAGGRLFVRLRQPRVIGEIAGGLLLGPTVLAHLWPSAHGWMFAAGPGDAVLRIVYQAGLLLLMFCSGLELRSAFQKREGFASLSIALVGTAVPFVAGLLSIRFGLVDTEALIGTAANPTSFTLVIAIAMAVTSIPVVSRIFHDLGILGTAFARIVLSAAVLEDVLLFVVLNVALSLVGASHGAHFGLPAVLGIEVASPEGYLYHLLGTGLFLGVTLAYGPGLYGRLARSRLAAFRISPVAMLLTAFVAVTGLAVLLGVAEIFGALLAGIAASTSGEGAEGARRTVERFSFALPIPIYFAIVGQRLDLVRHFDVGFFLLFFAVACLVKTAACYVGARLAKESHRGAFNLAVAMNARGGPGIVLASVAFDAAIIAEGMYTVLVMLSIFSSLIVGSLLDGLLRRGQALR